MLTHKVIHSFCAQLKTAFVNIAYSLDVLALQEKSCSNECDKIQSRFVNLSIFGDVKCSLL